ncbi:MAG: chitobiase/beta-hexosaminidase C-terminal domain-containing protein [Bacteroidetes bacterium]|nr:chitobiase/beta-hexosaminidase C-terminal domain-containing protein [Bacteroidota bacterium]
MLQRIPTEPAFNTAPGFYAGSVDVSVTGTNVYYTTDGDWPEASGIAYTSPITVGISKVVKIATIEPGKLPSRTVTGSFFINETTLLPVVSISSHFVICLMKVHRVLQHMMVLTDGTG